MNEMQPLPPVTGRIAFEGSLSEALAHVLALLPGAGVEIQLNVAGLDLRRPVRVHPPQGFCGLLEVGGCMDGEEGVHLGFITVHGLREQLLLERFGPQP